MSRHIIAAFALSGLLILSAASSSYGTLSYQLMGWSTGGELRGWSYDGTAADDLTAPLTGGTPNGYLQMHFDQPFPAIPENDRMWTESSDYTGNYNDIAGGILGVTFDFMGYADGSQALFFESTAGSGSSWGSAFASTADGVWETHSFSFESSAGWSQLSGSGSFEDALTSVSRIGLMMTHSDDSSAFNYGLDNWQLDAVPEPGTVALSVTALLGIACIARRRFFGMDENQAADDDEKQA